MNIKTIKGLSPELLASISARFSRSEDGIDALIEKVKDLPEEKAIQTIFNLADYGHGSIYDLSGSIPVALEGISLYAAFFIFLNCPIQAGQESSSRYIKKDPNKVIDMRLIQHTSDRVNPLPLFYSEFVEAAFARYEKACSIWGWVFDNHCPPEYKATIEGAKDAKVADRYKKNFVFDRARYFLPNGCLTNIVIHQNIREWTKLLKLLDSSMYPEFWGIASQLREALMKETPRSLKHSYATVDYREGMKFDFKLARNRANSTRHFAQFKSRISEEHAKSSLTIHSRETIHSPVLAEAFSNRQGRYGYQSNLLKRIAVTYRVNNCAIAEIRDLNRHRPGTRIFGEVPTGFYGALDEFDRIVPNDLSSEGIYSELFDLIQEATEDSCKALTMLDEGNPMYMYYTFLGTTFDWEHTTNLAHLAYIIELRSQIGAHYRYRKHVAEVYDILISILPSVSEYLHLGTAEPE